jgi:hypothetical protein
VISSSADVSPSTVPTVFMRRMREIWTHIATSPDHDPRSEGKSR